MKLRWMQISLVIISVLILIGAIWTLRSCTPTDGENLVKVRLELEETQIVSFENLCLIPGQACDYTVILESDDADECNLTIEFEEMGDGTLKNFAYVRIEANGEVLYDKLLATVFDGEKISLMIDFPQKQNTELTVTYYLPIEVGNDAKNAEVVFQMLLTMSNQ